MDVNLVLKREWAWGVSKLVLKKWYIVFDLWMEQSYCQKIWVIFLGLLWVLWQERILERRGNTLGRFIALEDGWDPKLRRHLDRIIVEFELIEGFLVQLKIEWGDWTFLQKLDYWKFTFRCKVCHQVGHVREQCLNGGYFQLTPKLIWVKNTKGSGIHINIINLENREGRKDGEGEDEMEVDSVNPYVPASSSSKKNSLDLGHLLKGMNSNNPTMSFSKKRVT